MEPTVVGRAEAEEAAARPTLVSLLEAEGKAATEP
jgi:hypothetical protein